MKKIRLGILFGGRSGEHEVSLQSATSVLNALNPAKYEVIPIAITKEGRWLLGPSLKGNAPPQLAAVLERGEPVIPPPDPMGPSLLSLNSHAVSHPEKPARLDVIFPVLHGTFGEDGTVQGLLDLAGIPYVGAGVLGSAVGMDKDVMKRLFRDAGLPIAPWQVVLRGDWERHPLEIEKSLQRKIGYPAFVKPANLGSSVGISKVHRREELNPALRLAAQYDRKIIVEKGIDAREIECSVLGNDRPEASVPGEILPVNEFYDYEAKYVREGSRLIIPARLSAAQTRKVRQFAIRAFKAIDCAGMARVDFLMERRKSTLYVNEINTIPGFTSISMYPKLWEATGVPYSELVDQLIELALERSREKSRTRYSY
ncbi:MAG TPA: D-alanine--D-alanine ligase family protein [Terriglobia bacterium]|nr:D-alanine--D-alanine ligase family protein [Terriglobia bacterium]